MCVRGIERDNEGLGVSAGERTNLETPDQGGRQRLNVKATENKPQSHFLHKV